MPQEDEYRRPTDEVLFLLCEHELSGRFRLVLTIGRTFCLFLRWQAEFWRWMNWQERLKGEQSPRLDIINKQNKLIKIETLTVQSSCSPFTQYFSINEGPIEMVCFEDETNFGTTIHQQDLFVVLYFNNNQASMQQQAARAAAKRLYQKISFSGGPLQSYQVSSLLTDTYDYLQIPFKPTSNDVKGMTEVLDVNRDGKVTLEDLENLAVQFLCGPGVLTPNSFDVTYKKPKYETSGVSTTYETSYSKPGISYKETFQKPSSRPSEKQQKSNNSIYNEEGEAYMRTARQIFQTYADSRYTITASEVPAVLSKTYETLGRKGYKPNNEDVKVWMKLCDGNEDGHVEYEEYEYFVVRSLERSGISIYK